MSNDIKILLTIQLEGGSFTREENKTYIPYALKAKELYRNLLRDKNGNLLLDKEGNFICRLPKEQAEEFVRKGARWHHNLKQNKVNKRIQIREDSYNFFISDTPFGGKYSELPIRRQLDYIKQWTEMSTEQRLEWHFNQMSEGKPFTYEVIE